MNIVSVSFPNPLRYAKAVTLCVALLLVLYVAFKKYSHDWVILFEAIGVSIFAIGFIVGVTTGFAESSIWIFVVCGIAAVLCGFLAVCFGVASWTRRRRSGSHGK